MVITEITAVIMETTPVITAVMEVATEAPGGTAVTTEAATAGAMVEATESTNRD